MVKKKVLKLRVKRKRKNHHQKSEQDPEEDSSVPKRKLHIQSLLS